MRLFIDTGNVAEVEEIASWGILSGATTNPSLLAKEDGDPGESIKRICDLVGGPTSAEVVSQDVAGNARRGPRAARAARAHRRQGPLQREGLEVTQALTDEGIPVNMTLVFSPNQALLAAAAGATYVSCFMGRLDDISIDSGAVLEEIADTLRAGGMTSEIIAASIRHPEHIVAAARIGCEIATTPAKVLRQMLDHPLTDAGAEKFRADWESRPEFGEWLSELTSKRLAAAG